MKVSLNWVKQYLDFELPATDELITVIGEQLGAVEEIIDYGRKYEGVIVAKVVSAEQHPDADRLHVCKLDDGRKAENVERDENGYVQVVCGAPNVREGIFVAWLPPGATVPDSYDTDPFVLEARKLRGVVSNGMLASQRELALGDDHHGILEIDEEAVRPGQPFAEVYGLDDTIIEIENKMFTHRPDCFGQLGVAREIAGILGRPFTSPDWYRISDKVMVGGNGLPLTLENQLSASAPRFIAVAMKDVTIAPSPVRIQTYLQRVGVKAINNVVDITNYLMLVTGQPTHAYDYDKVAALTKADGAALVVRYPQEGEKLALLNGKTIEPRREAIMIATDKQLIGVGGIMGGADTEVDENTKNIILEVASFDMYSIRRTSMAHGLFTDAVTRNNKGQSPRQVGVIAAQALKMLGDMTGGALASPVFDQKHTSAEEVHSVRASVQFITERLGIDLQRDAIARLLTNVEVKVKAREDEFEITPPFWRTDIELPEDIVEEVGRLHGFGNIPEILPLRPLTPVAHNQSLRQKRWVRETLAASGANEVLTYSFVHGNMLDRAEQNKSHAFSLSNALSPDLQYYRLSLTPSLLDKVHMNIKSGHAEFALFELGKIHEQGYEQEDGLPAEQDVIAFVFAADDKTAKRRYQGAPYYQARAFAERLLDGQGVVFKPLTEVETEMETIPAQLAPFAPQRSSVLLSGEEIIGVVGEYKASVRRAFKLPAYSAGFELALGLLGEDRVPSYVPLPRFPKVDQDITFRIPADISYGKLYEAVQASLTQHALKATRTQLTLHDIYQPADDDGRNITFRISSANYQRTLTANQVTTLLDAVAIDVAAVGAERI